MHSHKTSGMLYNLVDVTLSTPSQHQTRYLRGCESPNVLKCSCATSSVSPTLAIVSMGLSENMEGGTRDRQEGQSFRAFQRKQVNCLRPIYLLTLPMQLQKSMRILYKSQSSRIIVRNVTLQCFHGHSAYLTTTNCNFFKAKYRCSTMRSIQGENIAAYSSAAKTTEPVLSISKERGPPFGSNVHSRGCSIHFEREVDVVLHFIRSKS